MCLSHCDFSLLLLLHTEKLTLPNMTHIQAISCLAPTHLPRHTLPLLLPNPMLHSYLFLVSSGIMLVLGLTPSVLSSMPFLSPPGNTFSAFQTQLEGHLLHEAFLDTLITSSRGRSDFSSCPVCPQIATMAPLYGYIYLSICVSPFLGYLRQEPCHSSCSPTPGHTGSCSVNTPLRKGFVFLGLGIQPRDRAVSWGEDGGSSRATGPVLGHTAPWKAPGHVCVTQPPLQCPWSSQKPPLGL